MSVSVGPLVISLVLTNRIRRYVRISKLPQLEQLARYAMFFSVFLFAAEVFLSAVETTRWIWHLFLIALIAFSLKESELRSLRGFVLAFIPYIIVSLFSDLAQVIAADFFKTNEKYFDNASSLSIIWMIAILYSQNRQFKAAEKDRIKRMHEDEINRAIAIRKVELEVLVAERTSELTAQKDELEHTLNELRTTQSQLIQSEKMASLGELTAGIAHEIQNPLNFVNNFSEINTELIEELKEEIDAGNMVEVKAIAHDLLVNEQKINQHGKRADAIVKGMLQHSRSSAGQKEPADINALADEYLRLAYHGLRAKDQSFYATMETDFDETIGLITVIPQEIGRALLNLINNAFYAVNEKKRASNLSGSEKDLSGFGNLTGLKTSDPEDFENLQGLSSYEPTVSVTTKKLGNKVQIQVKDNGTGIPESAIDKIFQPFFTTKPSGQGTGLGLSLTYEIIKAHGGELKVETKDREGSDFSIFLPVNL